MRAVIRDLSKNADDRSKLVVKFKELRFKMNGVTTLVIRQEIDGATYVRYWSDDSELELS